MLPFDANKSLQELEGEDWGKPTFDSHLVTECHRLHRVPLRDFTVEDLRIMIGQHFSLEFLIPLALEHLRGEPLAEGAFYPGDLFTVVLRAGARFWQQHPDLRDEVAQIASSAALRFEGIEEVVDAYAQFRKDQTPVA